jgi:hypothetical protein
MFNVYKVSSHGQYIGEEAMVSGNGKCIGIITMLSIGEIAIS